VWVTRIASRNFCAQQPVSTVDDIERRNIMSTRLAIVTAALLTALVGPALAGDHDLVTLLRDSGRYVPEAGLPEWNARNIPAGAFAAVGRHTRDVVPPPMAHIPAPEGDFQLQGR